MSKDTQLPRGKPAEDAAGARLAQIAARLNAATPGPWYVAMHGSDGLKRDVFQREPEKRWDHPLTTYLSSANAEFIANAPEDIKYLLAALSTAERERGKHGIYIASRTRHAARWRKLRDEGCPIVCSWIDEAGPGETADWPSLWDRCIAEASDAAALIIYAGYDDTYLKGALVEVGAALAHGVPVYLVMVDRNLAGSAWNHRLVTECDSFEDALALALARVPSGGET